MLLISLCHLNIYIHWVYLHDSWLSMLSKMISVKLMVKNPPTMQETRVQSLGWEDSLEKGMTTHSSILAWRTPWTEKPGRLQSMGSQRIRQDSATDTFIFTFFSPLTLCIFWSFCPQTREQCARAQKEGEKWALPFPLFLQWVPVPPVFPQPTEGCT